jgi:ferredoxin
MKNCLRLTGPVAAFEKFLRVLRTVCGTLAKRREEKWQHGFCPLTSVCHAISTGAAKPSTRASGSFVRSGLNVCWNAKFSSLLDFAEACDVPVRWSCRTGVCHTCESGLISGNVDYQPEPLEPPAQGNLLICCSQPKGDVVIDL